MIFTDDLENIAEPNLTYAQQNVYSPTPRREAILTIIKEPSEDDSTNKRFNFVSLCLLCFLSFFSVATMFLSGEAEAGSAEEQLAEE